MSARPATPHTFGLAPIVIVDGRQSGPDGKPLSRFGAFVENWMRPAVPLDAWRDLEAYGTACIIDGKLVDISTLPTRTLADE